VTRLDQPPREPAQCAWYEGCSEPFYTSTPIPLCEAHAAELKKTDHEREMDLLREIRADLKTLLARREG
jgi:hypothetical protein